MNNNINIDTNKLKEKVQILQDDTGKMREIFDNLKKIVDEIPSYWVSNTSDAVMTDFRKMYSDFDTIVESNKKYIEFLESIVSSDYINIENEIESLIDTNL